MSVERFDLNRSPLDKMADFFYTNGFVILDNALDAETLEKLRNDLHEVHTNFQSVKRDKDKKKDEKKSVDKKKDEKKKDEKKTSKSTDKKKDEKKKDDKKSTDKKKK